MDVTWPAILNASVPLAGIAVLLFLAITGWRHRAKDGGT